MPVKKSRAQLQRERNEKQKKADAIKKLKASIGTMQLFGISKEVPTHNTEYNPRYLSDTTRSIKSNNKGSKTVATIKHDLSPEMEARELLAQKESERKSKRIAPLYSKGAYQYITDDTDLTTMGRKI